MKGNSVSCSYGVPYRNVVNNSNPSFCGIRKEYYGELLKQSEKRCKRSRNLCFATIGAAILSIATMITTGTIRNQNYDHPEKTHVITLDTPQKKENCDKAFYNSAIASFVTMLLSCWTGTAAVRREELLKEVAEDYHWCN